jgi:hypothetical protein
MTAAEACKVMIDLVRQLSMTRRERDGYRLLACQSIQALHALTSDHTRLRERYHRLLDERRKQKEAA